MTNSKTQAILLHISQQYLRGVPIMKHSTLFTGLKLAAKAAGLAIIASFMTAPATAQVLNGEYTVQQKSNNRYLDAYEGVSDNIAMTRPRESNNTQVWIFTPQGGDRYTIRQKSSGLFLDTFFKPVGGQDSPDKFVVATRPYNASSTQIWHLTKNTDGSYRIRSNSNRALEGMGPANDFAVLANISNNTVQQRWIIKPVLGIVLPLPLPAPVPPVTAPRTFSTGPITLRQTYTADLDRNSNRKRDKDIWFEAETRDLLYITPINGAKISVGNRRNRGYAGCAAARYSRGRVSLSDIPVGSYICVKTNEGRISQFRVNEISRRSPKVLKIGYTTWE